MRRGHSFSPCRDPALSEQEITLRQVAGEGSRGGENPSMSHVNRDRDLGAHTPQRAGSSEPTLSIYSVVHSLNGKSAPLARPESVIYAFPEDGILAFTVSVCGPFVSRNLVRDSVVGDEGIHFFLGDAFPKVSRIPHSASSCGGPFNLRPFVSRKSRR